MLRKRVKAILSGSVTPVLEQAGFQKGGSSFLREQGGCAALVEVQFSRLNSAGESNFTLNCGAYISGVVSALAKAQEPRTPSSAYCCVRARIGMLTESHRDFWWSVSADHPEADASVQADLSSVLERYALPFLARFPDIRAVAEFLSSSTCPSDQFVEPQQGPLRPVYAAILWHRLGDIGRCEAKLREAVEAARKTPLEEVVGDFARALLVPLKTR